MPLKIIPRRLKIILPAPKPPARPGRLRPSKPYPKQTKRYA